MSATDNVPRSVELRSLTVEDQRAIEGGGLLSGITNAIKSLATPVLSLTSSVVKKDSDTQSGVIGKI